MSLADAVYSKKQVNRAGRFLRDLRAAVGRGERPHIDRSELLEAIEVVEWWRALHAAPLARVNAGLRYYVQKFGAPEIDVTQRLKRFATIIDKLERHPNMQLSTMEDIGGVRAVLASQEKVDAIVADLRRQPRWKIRRLREYVEGGRLGPKPDGYRAVHLVVEKNERFVEIQLRTAWQDAWAQSVEQDTRRLRHGLKFGTGPSDLRSYYKMVSELFAMRESLREPDEEFMRELSKLYQATRRYYETPER